MILIKYGLFERLDLPFALDGFHFTVLLLATVCIAAGGNIINDIHDTVTDSINKPKKVVVGTSISEKTAYNLYMGYTFLGVIGGFWVANQVGKPSLAVIFIGTAALLYWYATSVKNWVLFGNILVSALVALSVIVLVLFDVFPLLGPNPNPIYLTVSKIILLYALAAFYLNVMREIVKDIQDINGDKNAGRNSLPMVLGISRTSLLLFAMAVFALFLSLYFCYYILYVHTYLLAYFLFLIAGPLLLFAIRAWSAEKQKDFAFLSLWIKICMFLGIGSLPLIKTLL